MVKTSTVVPLRSTFINKYLKCPRYAKLSQVETVAKKEHYYVGGIIAAVMTEAVHIGQEFNSGEYAAQLWLSHMATGMYACNDDQRNTMISRLSTAVDNYKIWYRESGFETLLTEITLYSEGTGGPPYAGRVDLIARRDGKIYLLDLKSHGMWGKGISIPKHTSESLKRDMQLAFYSLIMQDCMAAVGDCPRDKPSSEWECKWISNFKIKPDYVGLIELAYCVPYVRGDKAGQSRGDPLFSIPYSESSYDYAKEVAEYVGFNMFFKNYPRVSKYERGRNSCDGCEFRLGCFSENVTGFKPTVPDWIK